MKKLMIILGVLVLLLTITGFLVWKTLSSPAKNTSINTDGGSEITPDRNMIPLDPNITVTLEKSTSKGNTVVVTAKGMKGSMVSIAYELSYDSQGLIKGVNSGSKPIDVTGKNDFEREIYLGTCSRNVCRPDSGVSQIELVLEFTNTEGKTSQFTKEYSL